MAVLGIDKIYVSFFKLAYAEPRPYMIEPSITPISCSKAFGNPSGHSSASQLIGLILILDIFHGKEKTPKYFSKKAYVASILVAAFWAITIPYTRFVLGVHSLNQIVYGVTLGIWAGATMHFLIRDHLISHV